MQDCAVITGTSNTSACDVELTPLREGAAVSRSCFTAPFAFRWFADLIFSSRRTPYNQPKSTTPAFRTRGALTCATGRPSFPSPFCPRVSPLRRNAHSHVVRNVRSPLARSRQHTCCRQPSTLRQPVTAWIQDKLLWLRRVMSSATYFDMMQKSA